jgi:hypothetical protein
VANGLTRIHLVADHLSPLMTGQPACSDEGSVLPSDLRLQNNSASPRRGLTAGPRRAQLDQDTPASAPSPLANCQGKMGYEATHVRRSVGGYVLDRDTTHSPGDSWPKPPLEFRRARFVWLAGA